MSLLAQSSSASNPPPTSYREFGRGWVDKHIAPRGKIEGKRFGTAPNSPIKYSRTEFVALLEAERLQRAEIIGKYGQQEQPK